MKTAALLLSVVFTAFGAAAHSGGLDANGGHHDRKNGGYHYHRSPPTTSTSSRIQVRPSQISQPQPIQPAPTPVVPKPVISDAKQQELEFKTIQWQQKQAAAGSAAAQYDLAKRYFTGDGVAKDLDKAGSLFESAAKQGHPGAPAKLAEVLKEKELLAKTPTNQSGGDEVERLRKENQELRRLLANGETPSARPAQDPVSGVVSPAASPQRSPGETRLTPSNAGKWSLSSTGKRHNNTCRYYISGKACGPSEGVACKICGG